RRKNGAELLDRLTSTVAQLRGALEPQRSAYFEARRCFESGKTTPECWAAIQDLKYDSIEAAWNELDVRLASALLYVEGADEQRLVREMQNIKTNHFVRLKNSLPPRNAESARDGFDTISNTERDLDRTLATLANTLAKDLDGKTIGLTPTLNRRGLPVPPSQRRAGRCD